MWIYDCYVVCAYLYFHSWLPRLWYVTIVLYSCQFIMLIFQVNLMMLTCFFTLQIVQYVSHIATNKYMIIIVTLWFISHTVLIKEAELPWILRLSPFVPRTLHHPHPGNFLQPQISPTQDLIAHWIGCFHPTEYIEELWEHNDHYVFMWLTKQQSE